MIELKADAYILGLRKLIKCEYDDTTPLETEPDAKLKWSEPLAIQRDSCGLELTPAGERQLLWAACRSQELYSNQADTKLMSLVKDIFTYGGTSVQQVSDTYFATAYTWLPVVEKSNAKFNIRTMQEDTFALLLLCMYLLNQAPCRHPNHTSNSTLHKTTRRLFSLLDTLSDVSSYTRTTRLQAGLLLAAYECGHDILPSDVVSYMNGNESYYVDEIRKFRIRTRSALLIGEAIRVVYGDIESSDCVEAEKLLHEFIRQHVTSHEESYPVCEGITLALSAVVSAYKKKTKRPGSAADAKLNLDIRFAYNITFEMCRIEGSIMRTREKGLQRLCFAGLGCLYRAAVDLDEVCPKGAAPEDVKQLRENLEWFSSRWKVADVLLKRLDRNASLRSKEVIPISDF
ncbi:hypothetical protein ACHAQJ_010334 [Trichoderma viride]